MKASSPREPHLRTKTKKFTMTQRLGGRVSGATVLLFSFTVSTLKLAYSDPSYLYHFCSDTTTFAANSSYEGNLQGLLSSLSSNASSSFGFYNTSQGRDPDRAYGLFLCRGDVSTAVCSDCVAFSTRDVVKRCPYRKIAYIWYDVCFLRYSNQSFFSVMSSSPTFYMWNTLNNTNQAKFNEVVMDTFNNVSDEAASSGARFAVGEVNFTRSQEVHVLAQCTPDLTVSDCYRCLQMNIAQLPNCCSGKQGGRVLSPSCNIRYEVYSFYNSTAVGVPPPSPSAPPVGPEPGKKHISAAVIVAIVAPIVVSILLYFVVCFIQRRRARKKYYASLSDGTMDITAESLKFDFGTIESATQKFSDANKLGEGGFGEVYKGSLPNGQEIAVKRLSKLSVQGVEEFKNEVVLVAKLQHRNLVRLLGFCLEGKEKILIYEFVRNKSLDYFLFGSEKQVELDWPTRYKIIVGIARGIIYLHQDSRYRIIHRDLKASNILLDGDMNPKISDFGMARMVGVDDTQDSTKRIVGTYGYMSPEYAMHGQFSVKSDVYSFGVLVLEIITEKRNSSFYQTEGPTDLISYVWKHWTEKTPMEVLNSSKVGSYKRDEVMRCLHIGLLCVQEDPSDRPTMPTIALLLNSHSMTLLQPKKPAFFLQGRMQPKLTVVSESDQSASKSAPWSVDDASITEVHPR